MSCGAHPAEVGDAGVARAYVGGTGSASTLAMTDEEKQQAAEREQEREPLGFRPAPLEQPDS